MKSLANDLINTCDEIVDTPNNIAINLNNGINYWLFTVVLLAIVCLLLLLAIVVKHYMKGGLAILWLLSYERWISHFMVVIILV